MFLTRIQKLFFKQIALLLTFTLLCTQLFIPDAKATHINHDTVSPVSIFQSATISDALKTMVPKLTPSADTTRSQQSKPFLTKISTQTRKAVSFITQWVPPLSVSKEKQHLLSKSLFKKQQRTKATIRALFRGLFKIGLPTIAFTFVSLFYAASSLLSPKAKKIFLTITFLLLLVSLPVSAQTTAGYFPQFSRNFTTQELITDVTQQATFINQYIQAEAKFHQPGVGFNNICGITYDGISINYETGELMGAPRNWSASSKESLQMTILSLAISGDEKAKLFISPDNPANAEKIAIDILTKKITTYENFNRAYPQFGGFLPWVLVKDQGIQPTHDWQDRVPGLDNGQLAWSLFLTDHILQTKGYAALAKRYNTYWNMLAKNAVPIFYDKTTGNIRAEVKIAGSKDNITYTNNVPGYMLNDPYEGEMMALFMSLFGTWEAPGQRDAIWQNKKMQAAVYRTQSGKLITVRQGHWYSSHEMWNFMVLPYTDDPLIKEVIYLGEVARTIHSAENSIPGLFASVNPPVGSVPSGVNYISATGIGMISKQPVEYTSVVTPYAAFPVILTDVAKGITWLKVMIDGPRMYGPYGSTESITIDGKLIAPYLTWDAKVTTILALMNNASMDQMRAALKTAGVYTQFLTYVGTEYKETFGSIKQLKGQDIDIAIPTTTIPRAIPDFKLPGTTTKTDILKGTKFQGGGALASSYKRLSNGDLYLPTAEGYIYNSITPTDVATHPILTFKVKTAGGAGKGLYLEIKNTADALMTDQKIKIEFPDTKGQWQTFTIDISKLVTHSNKTAAIIAFSDVQVPMSIKSITFDKTAQTGSTKLIFDGRRFLKEIPKQTTPATQNITNILSRINFNPGGGIKFSHTANLKLQSSGGWIWSFAPKNIVLNNTPYLYIRYKTTSAASFSLELKNKSAAGEQQIVADQGSDRMRIQLKNTGGRYITEYIPLPIKPGMKTQSRLDVIAISDPRGDVEIEEMAFTKTARVSSIGSIASGLIAAGIGFLSTALQLATFGIPLILASLLLLLNRKTTISLPLRLEAFLKSLTVIYPFAGAILMWYQAYQIKKAKQQAQYLRTQNYLPAPETLEQFKTTLEKRYNITLIDDAITTQDIAFVNPSNTQDIANRVIHTQLPALYLLYLKAPNLVHSILNDHETSHFKSKSEAKAYTKQMVNIRNLFNGALADTTPPAPSIVNFDQTKQNLKNTSLLRSAA